MRTPSIPSLPILLLLFFFLPRSTALAQCDSVTAVKKSPTGCTNWFVQNRNVDRKTITRIRFELLTSGMSWAGTALVDSWTVALPAPNILELDAGSGGLRTGVDMYVNLVCLSRVCANDRDYQVKWTTFDGATQICSGTETLACQAMEREDSLAATLHPVDWRCHRLTLHNFNSLNLAIDELSLTSLTPGANPNITPPAGWAVQSNAGTTTLTADPDPLNPNDSLPGIQLCFTQTPPNTDTVSLLWSTGNNGIGLSSDTLRIRLGRQPRCDSMVLTFDPNKTNPACKALTFFNLHEPQSDVTSILVQVVSDGAVFSTGASGPWNLTQETAKFLRFVAPGTGIGNGDSVGTFTFCVTNASGVDSVLFRVTSETAGKQICSVEQRAFVPSIDGLCDLFLARRTGGQNYVLGFFNRRLPALPVNGFSLEILNSSPTLSTVSPPSGWTLQNSTSASAAFRGTTVFPGGTADGFEVAFDGAQQDTVLLQVCTSFDGNEACCDTLVLPITSGESRCDSLLLTEAPVPGSCQWKAGFVNLHLPASLTTQFRLQALTPSTRFNAQNVPAGWVVSSDGSSGVLTVQRDTATTEGLAFDLTVESSSETVLFEWCTEDASGPICCGFDSLFCAAEEKCGEMNVQEGSHALQRRLSFHNIISPEAVVEQLRISVLTAGTGFDAVNIPKSWTMDISATKDTVIITPDAPILTDNISASFDLTLSEAPGCDSIRWQWEAMAGDAMLCGSMLPALPCPSAACDTVTFSTDAARPCCFDIRVQNSGSGEIDGFTLSVLTPGASAFASTIVSPDDWTLSGDTTYMQWSTTGSPILEAGSLDGFTVCFNNGWIGNEDFLVLWQTLTGRTVRCSDTLTIACDRTLTVEHLDAAIPAQATLQQNYPNPFADGTSIVFALPHQQRVTLQVYDTHGRRVASLCSGSYAAGSYRVHFDAGTLPAGMYLVRLTAGNVVRTQRMSLIR